MAKSQPALELLDGHGWQSLTLSWVSKDFPYARNSQPALRLPNGTTLSLAKFYALQCFGDGFGDGHGQNFC